MNDIYRYLIGIGAPAITLVGLFVFFKSYETLWKATTDEPWTNILRRNKAKFGFIFLPGLGAGFGLGYLVWPLWPWVVVAGFSMWFFFGHIFWAGIRWGGIHRQTAWRCKRELELMGESLELGPKRDAMELAAKELEARLNDLGIPYSPSDRSGVPKGLTDI